MVIPRCPNVLCWQALAHLLVIKDGKVVDMSDDPRAEGGLYVFVTSSRVAESMPDRALITGGFVLPSVVGGSADCVDMMVRRFGNIVSPTPELAAPKAIQKVHIPVGLAKWAAERHPNENIADLTKRMGIASISSGKLDLTAAFYEKMSVIETISESQEQAQASLSEVLDRMFEEWQSIAVV
jgi:hypothetical protein